MTRLTTAQALVRWMVAQRSELLDGTAVPLFAGVFAIFGHGNVLGLGTALQEAGDDLPTWRGQNEQGMALAAVAYARATDRRQVMAATSSIGPGALNMVTAAGVAHANRLPVLLLAGDTFAGRAPDPVLQQVEHFGDPTHVGQRLVPRGVALLRPDHPARAAARLAAAGGAGAHRPGRLRPGRARAAAGRAGRGVRLPRRVLRAARAPGAAGPRRRRPRSPPRPTPCAPPRVRCWCSAAGSATPAPRPRRSRSPRRTAYPSSRPSPAARWCPTTTRCTAGALGIVGSASANALAAAADVVARGRDPAPGLHHLVVDRLRRRRAPGLGQRRPLRRRQARRPRGGRRRARGAGRADRRPRRRGSRRRSGPTGPPRSARPGTPPSTGCARRPRPAHLRPGHRRGQRRLRPRRLRAHRLRRHARRAARRLAHRRGHARRDLRRDHGPGVRLLLHGLRDRRARGAPRWPAPAPTPTAWSPRSSATAPT